MTTLQRFGAATAALTLSLTLAACGQKAGVETAAPAYAPAGGTAGTVVDPATGQVVPIDAVGAPVAGGAPLEGGGFPEDSATTGSPGGGGGGGAGGGGGTGGGGGGGTGGGDGDGVESGGGDTTGVTGERIRIGVHAPVTGAAAIPQSSFERAVGVYFDAVNRKGGIFGRKIEVIFEDDQFRPDVARTKCKELAEQDEVFLLIGGAGADQIDSCARYAAEAGVPYLSAGVHETRPGQTPLGDLSTYFALSLTYDQQVPMLARLYKSLHTGDKVVVITADNDSLNGYHDKAVSAVQSAAGGSFAYAERIPKNTQSEALSIGTKICNSGAEAVIWNASPSTLLNVAKSMACRPRFIGPGLTNGLNIVANVGCPNLDGAVFYSPFPGMDVMRGNSQFVADYQASNGAAPDDIGAAIYGVERVVAGMLAAAGQELSREGFMSTIAKVKKFDGGGVYPPTNFTSRFGGTAMHLLQADCGSREYKTVRTNEAP
jgi:ABC-type branched-subunit amino acid transport system substrate-binding protein